METQEHIKIDWMGVSPRVTRMVMETADKLRITPTEAIKLVLEEKSSSKEQSSPLPLSHPINPTTTPDPKRAA